MKNLIKMALLALAALAAVSAGSWSVATFLRTPLLSPEAVVLSLSVTPAPTDTPPARTPSLPPPTSTRLAKLAPSPSRAVVPPPGAQSTAAPGGGAPPKRAPTRATTRLPSGAPRALDAVPVAFYYDGNLNRRQDAGEELLNNLQVSIGARAIPVSEGTIRLPANSVVNLQVKGNAPNGKPLSNATLQEPDGVVILPGVQLRTASAGLAVGLADGYLTSPIRPAEIAGDLIVTSASKRQFHEKYFPESWSFPFNAYVYGYRIPDGDAEGQPHLALDVWARPGTGVFASAGGQVEWTTVAAVSIRGAYGTLLYMHLNPSVAAGMLVKRYDRLGSVQDGELKHVHIQVDPDRPRILSAFPGIGADYLFQPVKRAQDIPILPYFGQ